MCLTHDTNWLNDWVTDSITDKQDDLPLQRLNDKWSDKIANQVPDWQRDWWDAWLNEWLLYWTQHDWQTNWQTDWLLTNSALITILFLAVRFLKLPVLFISCSPPILCFIDLFRHCLCLYFQSTSAGCLTGSAKNDRENDIVMISPSKAHRLTAGHFPLCNPKIRG